MGDLQFKTTGMESWERDFDERVEPGISISHYRISRSECDTFQNYLLARKSRILFIIAKDLY